MVQSIIRGNKKLSLRNQFVALNCSVLVGAVCLVLGAFWGFQLGLVAWRDVILWSGFIVFVMACVLYVFSVKLLKPFEYLGRAVLSDTDDEFRALKQRICPHSDAGVILSCLICLLDELKVKELQLASGQSRNEQHTSRRIGELVRKNAELEDIITSLKKANTTIVIGEENKKIASERAKFKTQFLANMSHELRTPMNGVLGMLETLRSTGLDEEQAYCVRKAESCGDELLQLLNEILDFSCNEGEGVPLEFSEFNIADTVDEVVASFVGSSVTKGVDLVCYELNSVPGELKGDAARLKQVLGNLMANAFKFTHEGHVQLTYQALEEVAGQVMLQFNVEDTGIGVDDQSIERIFTLFSQGDESSVRRFEGAGIGLALCKQSVELMGGKIGVDSTVGRGSRFWVKIPFEVLGSANQCSADALYLLAKEVLVLDASAASAKAMCRFSEKMGSSRVRVFSNAEKFHTYIVGRDLNDIAELVLIDIQSAAPRLADLTQLFISAEFSGRLIFMGNSADRASLINPQEFKFLNKPARYASLVSLISGQASEAVEAHEPNAPNAPEPLSPIHVGGTGSRILLVEDNEVNQVIALKRLRRMGYQSVELAKNGLVAVDKVAGGDYDLILMDCQMPELDGYEATRMIRASECGSNKHIPIIALTAHSLAADKKKCLDAGMDDFLSKPFKSERLQQLMSQWIKE